MRAAHYAFNGSREGRDESMRATTNRLNLEMNLRAPLRPTVRCTWVARASPFMTFRAHRWIAANNDVARTAVIRARRSRTRSIELA